MINKRGLKPTIFLLKNRRGISSIIATLLLILLTITILGVLWLIVRNITSSASEGISLGGITLDLKIQKVSIIQNNISVLVQRQQGEGNLVGINFVVYDGYNYENIKKNTTLEIYEGKEYIFPVSDVNINLIKTISVAPIYLSNSGVERTGRITDTYTFGEDTPGSGTGELICGDGTCNVGETVASCPADCLLGPVCGNSALESGEQCDDGNTNNGDGCSSTCQDEVLGTVCGNDICELGETTSSCLNDCPSQTCIPTTCLLANYQCGAAPDGCGGALNCGPCSGDTFCNIYFQCESYQMVNNGTILSVWPSGAALYFDSENLPKSEIELIAYNDGLHYIRFPPGSSQPGCIRIALADYILENNRSYIELYSVANIASGNNYEIWNGQQGCLNAL